jgi:hypothetical protein
MPSKTFKVGEWGYCNKYKLTTNKTQVKVDHLEPHKGNAKTPQKVFTLQQVADNDLENYLSEQTSAYYAGEMVSWVKSKVTLPKQAGLWAW